MGQSQFSFFELIQDDSFRDFCCKRLLFGAKDPEYSFPNIFPRLYKYTRLADHVVDNIINNRISATRIGEFNDLFDGTLHHPRTAEECNKIAEKNFENLSSLMKKIDLPEDILDHHNLVKTREDSLKEEVRLRFRTSDFINTYVCCLSLQNRSTLMWSHYAASNTGICIEYDFNRLEDYPLFQKCIFPVAYSAAPINLKDLIEDEKREIFQYSSNAAVLCAVLNKANEWSYEQEWRIVLIFDKVDYENQWQTYPAPVPSSITFGYHFLKPCFYYDGNKDENTCNAAKAYIQNLKKLLEYMERNGIPAAVMKPVIGSYQIESRSVSVKRLQKLICGFFNDNDPEDMRYYYTAHDQLMDMLDE